MSEGYHSTSHAGQRAQNGGGEEHEAESARWLEEQSDATHGRIGWTAGFYHSSVTKQSKFEKSEL